MKRFASAFIFLVFSALAITGTAAASGKEEIASVNFYVGNVKVQRSGDTVWFYAKVATPLYEGDLIDVGGSSKLELIFADESLIRLGENTKFRMEAGQDKRAIKLMMGKTWSKVKKLKQKSQLEVRTPTAVAGVRGTTFRVDVDREENTDVGVYNGEVSVTPVIDKAKKKKSEGGLREIKAPFAQVEPPMHEVSQEEWMVILKNMQSISIGKDGKKNSPKQMNMDEEMKDPWLKWNMERDEARSTAGETEAAQEGETGDTIKETNKDAE